jgi:hypothetical protein
MTVFDADLGVRLFCQPFSRVVCPRQLKWVDRDASGAENQNRRLRHRLKNHPEGMIHIWPRRVSANKNLMLASIKNIF